MALTPKVQGINIVLLGDFNPKIFQPAWFAAEELIGKQQADEADVEVVHSHVVVFSLDWLKIQVDRDRFIVWSMDEPYEKTRDFISGTFRLLRHTPIRKMGINKDMHFQMASEKRWHAFGHLLAPKERWEGVLEKPGMRSLTMESVRPDGIKGYIWVRVEPSVKVHPGVYFHVNDHYEVDDPESVVGCEEMIGILERVWDESQERSNRIIYSMLERP